MPGQEETEVELKSHNICPVCKQKTLFVPPEPPLGTWVKDRFGCTAVRMFDCDGREGWSQPGFYALASWPSFWKARGPLKECGPWGDRVVEENLDTVYAVGKLRDVALGEDRNMLLEKLLELATEEERINRGKSGG